MLNGGKEVSFVSSLSQMSLTPCHQNCPRQIALLEQVLFSASVFAYVDRMGNFSLCCESHSLATLNYCNSWIYELCFSSLNILFCFLFHCIVMFILVTRACPLFSKKITRSLSMQRKFHVFCMQLYDCYLNIVKNEIKFLVASDSLACMLLSKFWHNKYRLPPCGPQLIN